MSRRRGFTLVELMIVIVIIVILIAVLTPAIGAALRNARQGQVKQEIGQIEYAIADFNSHFGINPPSYIDFRLDSSGQLPPATQSVLRRMWPNIDMPRLVQQITNGELPQQELHGSQCLVFFLGGLVPGAGEVPVGFAANPRAPFTLGGTRVGPFFEFRLDRLYDANPATFDGYEGYLDTLPGQRFPYWYVTSDRYSRQDAANSLMTALPAAKAMRPVYRQSAKSYFNAQGFQIVSPGYDGTTAEHDSLPGGAYGTGGTYDAKAGTVTESLPDGSGPEPAHPLLGQAKGDADNITNFASGPLAP